MNALIAIAVLATPNQSAAKDFFPMEPGMKWSYEVTGDGGGTYSQEIGTPIDVGGTLRNPLLIKVSGRLVQTTFYDIQGSGVYVIGHDPKVLFEKPQPVFQLEGKGSKWEYEGPSPYDDDKSARMRVKGQSKLVGQRTVLGEKRECLEVDTETRIGLSESTATLFKRSGLYAKGVGLVQMEENVSVGRRSQKRKVQLTKFESAKAGN